MYTAIQESKMKIFWSQYTIEYNSDKDEHNNHMEVTS